MPKFGFDGIAGIGLEGLAPKSKYPGYKTVFDNLADQYDLESKNLKPVFSFEMTGSDGTDLEHGHLIFGALPTERFGGAAPSVAPVLKMDLGHGAVGFGFWLFGIEAWSVGSVKKQYAQMQKGAEGQVSAQGFAMVDSGTSCLILTTPAWDAFVAEAASHGMAPGSADICTHSNIKLTFTIDRYVYEFSPQDYCLGGVFPCVQPPIQGGSGIDMFLLGDVFHRKYYTAYNFGKNPKVLISRLGATRDARAPGR